MKRTWFQRLVDLVLGRRWFFSVDPASMKGDYTGFTLGYIDRGGNYVVTKTGAWKHTCAFHADGV